MVTGFVIVVALVLALIFWFVGIRNRLNQLRNELQHRWSEVDLELTGRDELIRGATSYPAELLEAGYAACEAATRQRQAVWQQGGPIQAPLLELIAAEEAVNALEIKKLIQSPELKEAEVTLEGAVTAYNQAVTHYNQRITQAPGSWLARSGGHKLVDQFTPHVPAPLTPAAS